MWFTHTLIQLELFFFVCIFVHYLCSVYLSAECIRDAFDATYRSLSRLMLLLEEFVWSDIARMYTDAARKQQFYDTGKKAQFSYAEEREPNFPILKPEFPNIGKEVHPVFWMHRLRRRIRGIVSARDLYQIMYQVFIFNNKTEGTSEIIRIGDSWALV